MRIVLIAAPIVVGLIAAVATIVVGGLFIPRGHRTSRAIRLSAPPEQVWAVITDFPSHPSWRPGVKSIQREADRDGRPVWREFDKHGQSMPVEIMIFTPPSRMVGRIADDSLPFAGTWTYEVTADEKSTRLRITEDGEIRSSAFRYIAKTMGYSATIEQYLEALAKKMGDPAEVEP